MKRKNTTKRINASLNLNLLIKILIPVCIVSVLGLVYAVTEYSRARAQTVQFVPPVFDCNTIDGIPAAPESLNYTPLKVEDGYMFSSCGILNAHGETVDIYFTSPEDNRVWMLLKLYDEKDNLLSSTGLIKPGQYLKSLTLDTIPKNSENVRLKVVAYEPETYHSMGTVTLNMKLNIETEDQP